MLWIAFLSRVLGQAWVGLAAPAWLPPWEAWMSGALGYPWLLASQLAILLLYGWIARDFTRGRGVFVAPHAFFRTWLLGVAFVYLAGMALRIPLSRVPGYAWVGDPIPILFHLVLAGFLLLVALWHRGR